MGLFSNFNGMGPGGAPEPEPRTGLGRFWQVFSRHSPGLMASGLLASLTALVYIAAVFLGVTSHGLIFVLVGGPIGGLIAMPQIVGVADTVLRGIRGEAGFWWMRYRKAWRKDLRQSLLLGLIAGFLFSFQYFMLLHARNVSLLVFVLMLAGIFISVAVATWSVPQVALMELPLGRVLLNSLVLSAQHPVKTLISVIVTMAYWFLMVVTYPFSLLGYLFLSFWFPMLICLLTIWPSLDDAFHISDALEAMDRQKRAEAREAELAEVSDSEDGEAEE